MVPTNLADWFENRWKVLPGGFWNTVYLGKATRALALYMEETRPTTLLNGTVSKVHQPQYNLRGAHELAHLVTCPDNRIMSPSFGADNWFDNKTADVDDALAEIVVVYIAWLVGEETTGHKTGDTYPRWHTYQGYGFGDLMTQAQFEAQVKTASQTWTLEEIYAELQRKYKILDALETIVIPNPVLGPTLLRARKPINMLLEQEKPNDTMANPRRHTWPTKHHQNRRMGNSSWREHDHPGW